MNYQNFEKVVSAPRLTRFLVACSYDKTKAIELYKRNMLFSRSLFSVISLFEIALRNVIDNHYTTQFGHNWVATQSSPNGFLSVRGCEKTRQKANDAIMSLKAHYSHDQVIAELNFGFWRYLFASKEFRAGGSNLLKIFPNRPFGKNHTDIFNDLSDINIIRNRIAHHEPLCFGLGNTISTTQPIWVYNTITDLFNWLDIDSTSFLNGIDDVEKVADNILLLEKKPLQFILKI